MDGSIRSARIHEYNKPLVLDNKHFSKRWFINCSRVGLFGTAAKIPISMTVLNEYKILDPCGAITIN